ncbi:MAG: hypothetical protein WAW39_19985 [Prosthecobacter sp.]|uniref:hypothetical protein n=1 Tax=Prosthecobacter sp. TaxID=1965333 RepID=UPI003BB0EE81
MNQYFCHDCALRDGLINPLDTSMLNLTGTPYQFDKYLKHTAPTRGYQNLLSIFNRPEYGDYLGYTVNTSLSGCVEIDSAGRTNLIWYAGRHVGVTYKDSRYYCPDDSIKVVLYDNFTGIHSFPVNWELQYINRCKKCDRPILS